ncbi:MAG: hypothetical protein AB7K24_18360 [Gemmataceae bacterium]
MLLTPGAGLAVVNPGVAQAAGQIVATEQYDLLRVSVIGHAGQDPTARLLTERLRQGCPLFLGLGKNPGAAVARIPLARRGQHLLCGEHTANAMGLFIEEPVAGREPFFLPADAAPGAVAPEADCFLVKRVVTDRAPDRQAQPVLAGDRMEVTTRVAHGERIQ